MVLLAVVLLLIACSFWEFRKVKLVVRAGQLKK
uniref:Uncharacterized protein n=1 Tax=Arundo donax TaxID=35708 RepID=A0A0A9EGJ2_ARUDO